MSCSRPTLRPSPHSAGCSPDCLTWTRGSVPSSTNGYGLVYHERNLEIALEYKVHNGIVNDKKFGSISLYEIKDKLKVDWIPNMSIQFFI